MPGHQRKTWIPDHLETVRDNTYLTTKRTYIKAVRVHFDRGTLCTMGRDISYLAPEIGLFLLGHSTGMGSDSAPYGVSDLTKYRQKGCRYSRFAQTFDVYCCLK